MQHVDHARAARKGRTSSLSPQDRNPRDRNRAPAPERGDGMRRSIPLAVAFAGLLLALAVAPRAALADRFAGTIPDQTLRVGVAFSLTLPEVIETGGATITYSIAESLPGGLSSNASTRVLSGTPTTVQVQTEYTYRGYNERDYNTTSQKFKITILAAQDITLSKSTVTVTEGSSNGTYKTSGLGNVTVSVASGDPGAATVSPSSLTFTTANYGTNQTVTVTPVQDNDSNDESLTIKHGASGGGYDGETKSVSVTVTDDDTALAASAVTHNSATLTISNHTGNWYYKKTVPSGDTTCTLVSSGTYTASLSSLTPGTSYTYKAYSNSTCATEITNDATDADFITRPPR